jgi:NAD(P)-dependent dehydrogenase (short-subunit alcohol dehydrogenase family)
MTLAGQVAIITGATSGIGARTAELFANEGARVVIAGRRQERGQRLARALGDRACFVRTDVTVEADVERMIAHAVDRFGGLDCLINNAGRSPNTRPSRMSIWSSSTRSWRFMCAPFSQG